MFGSTRLNVSHSKYIYKCSWFKHFQIGFEVFLHSKSYSNYFVYFKVVSKSSSWPNFFRFIQSYCTSNACGLSLICSWFKFFPVQLAVFVGKTASCSKYSSFFLVQILVMQFSSCMYSNYCCSSNFFLCVIKWMVQIKLLLDHYIETMQFFVT